MLKSGMGGYYVLVGQTPVPTDAMTWAHWFQDVENRIVKQERVGNCFVSTVFLGLDHSFGYGPPKLFETMTFYEDDTEEDCQRCSTWLEAEAQHDAMVAKVSKIAAPREYYG